MAATRTHTFRVTVTLADNGETEFTLDNMATDIAVVLRENYDPAEIDVEDSA